MSAVLFALPGAEALAARLAPAIGADQGAAEMRRFPDGEVYVRLDSEVARRPTVLAAAMERPDDKVLPLMMAAGAARELGASRVLLVAPYLPYMRQDRRFKRGEGVTSTYFARFLSAQVDALVTVDPHLHRRTSLAEIYSIPTVVVHAAPVISRWILEQVERPVLVGPDEESAQWVGAVATAAEAPFTVLRKERRGDRDVAVSVPDVERWAGHTPVLVDDIVSTARTMVATVGHLLRAGMRPPICVGVHAVFAGAGYEELIAAGAGRVVTCNTIAHASNAIDVTPLLADAIQTLSAAGPGVASTTANPVP
jgi:ribose-phosphate pyrophosphokinase